MLFQRLQQRIGRLKVQRLRRVQHHHLAAATGAGLENPVDDAAHFGDANLLAGLALGVFAVGLVVGAQPVVLAPQDFGHQHLQVGVQVRLHEAATAAATARRGFAAAIALVGTFTQPSLRQRQREGQHAVALAAVQQQRVATLRGQHVGQWAGQPGQRQRPGVVNDHIQRPYSASIFKGHRHHPLRPSSAASICCQTAPRSACASMRTNRCGCSSWRLA